MLRAQQSFQKIDAISTFGTKFVGCGDDDTPNKQSQLAMKDLLRDRLNENDTRINWLLVASIQFLYF